MSGLGELGGMPQFLPGYNGQVAQRDIDQYVDISIDTPSVDTSWFGTTSGTAAGTIVTSNVLPDWPRNICYSVNGITNGTYGGTLTATFYDQFGTLTTETVVIGTAVNGGTTYGSAICSKFISGSFGGTIASAGTFIGTARLGLGTASNGSAQSNWFGLLSRLGGTSDVKSIVWISSSTPTTLNKGTAIGTLVNTTLNAFQGTSGVAATDHYRVIFKPSYDNLGKGTMCAL